MNEKRGLGNGRSQRGDCRLQALIFVLMIMLVGEIWPGLCALDSHAASYQIKRRDKINGVDFIDQRTGFAVGNKGLLIKTDDGGRSWEIKESIKRRIESFNGVDFHGFLGWVVGGKGLILHTDDAGETWHFQTSGSTEALMAVTCINSTDVIIVGSGGVILRSADAGTSWSMVELDWSTMLPEEVMAMGMISPNLYDVFFVEGGRGWIVGDNGLVLRSDDGGGVWSLLSVGSYPTLYSVYFKNAREGFAVGQEGSFLYTGDGGVSWERRFLSPEVADTSLYKICFKGSDGLIVGDRGLILRSSDGGTDWQKEPSALSPPLPWLIDTCIVSRNSPGEAIVVGQGTMIRVPIGK